MTRELTIKQVGYEISGVATLNLWGGGQGKITMEHVVIDELTTENVLRAVNDNGFGCESIDYALVDINILYEYDVSFFYKHVEFNRRELWGKDNEDISKNIEEYEKRVCPIVDDEVVNG